MSKRYPLRTRLLRWLHWQLKDLGIAREEFKARMGVGSMNEWSIGNLISKNLYLLWLRHQPWHVRHEHGAAR